MPFLAFASFGAAIGLGIWQLGERSDLIAGAMRLDELTIVLTFIFSTGGMAAVLLSWRSVAVREASHGEFYALMLTSSAGMFVLVILAFAVYPQQALDHSQATVERVVSAPAADAVAQKEVTP